ncbi:hypothetical protein Tco_0155205 [Tanacetum coccineum]
MDWMAKHRAEVVCYEKYIRVPYGNDMLIVQGERSGVKNESRLEVISSIRTQKYIDQGCQVFLIQIMKEEETKIPERRIEDVPVVKDLPEDREEDYSQDCFQNNDTDTMSSSHAFWFDHRGTTPETIMELLKKEELYAKFSKCEFWINTVKFLGHVINNSGIHVDPTKIDAVKNWASPTTPSEIRQFLGLAGYYRGFIEGFSKLAKPMTELTQKN